MTVICINSLKVQCFLCTHFCDLTEFCILLTLCICAIWFLAQTGLTCLNSFNFCLYNVGTVYFLGCRSWICVYVVWWNLSDFCGLSFSSNISIFVPKQMYSLWRGGCGTSDERKVTGQMPQQSQVFWEHQGKSCLLLLPCKAMPTTLYLL